MSVRVIDFSTWDERDPRALRDLADAVDVALAMHGFMAVTNIGIADELRERAFASAHQFFNGPVKTKVACTYTDPVSNFGYQALLSETLEPGLPADIKEAFTMRDLLASYPRDGVWPSDEFRDTAREFFLACRTAASRILRVFTVALDVPPDFFDVRHTGHNLTMRYLHYPSRGLGVESDAQMGAGAHTDYGSITLLFQDAVGGLQLRRADGSWMDVVPVPKAVNINTGDLMERWSNGRYPSTEHRVLPRIGHGDRYSIAYFTDPDSSTLVQCLPSCVSAERPARYRDLTAGEHIQSKIDASQSRERAVLLETAGDTTR
jgi:isopenicillin N synthase-like dioxygenase